MEAKKKYILMDIDGTLFDSEKAYKTVLIHIGIDPESLTWQEARNKTKTQLQKFHTSARNRWLYFKKYLEAINQFCPTNLIRISDQYETELSMELAKQWNQLGREDFFKSLLKKRPDLKIIFITNETLRTQIMKLSRLQGSDWIFKDLLCSEEIGFEKPDSKIFHFILNHYQLKPEEGFMVGDDFEKDILGAQRIGFETIHTKEFIGKDQKLKYSFDVSKPKIFAIEQLIQLIDFL